MSAIGSSPLLPHDPRWTAAGIASSSACASGMSAIAPSPRPLSLSLVSLPHLGPRCKTGTTAGMPSSSAKCMRCDWHRKCNVSVLAHGLPESQTCYRCTAHPIWLPIPMKPEVHARQCALQKTCETAKASFSCLFLCRLIVQSKKNGAAAARQRIRLCIMKDACKTEFPVRARVGINRATNELTDSIGTTMI